jgi:multidrug efflux pump subunit AcrA (membrane-fusion protein)
MRRRIAHLIAPAGAALLAGAVLAYSAARPDPYQAAQASEPAVPVVAAPVQQGSVPIYLRVSATCKPTTR